MRRLFRGRNALDIVGRLIMEKRIIDPKKTSHQPKDVPDGIVGDLINFDLEVKSSSGELLLLYKKAPKGITDIARYISLNTKPDKFRRTSGLPQSSSVFGVLPRNSLRYDYCRFSRKCKDEKHLYRYALELNRLISLVYKKELPEHYHSALEEARSTVDASYRVQDTPWTNINVNMNQVIKYHRDSGNNRKDLSNVLIVKRGVEGGYLPCPELGLTLAQEDGWMVFFKGQEVLHGVTPCVFKNGKSYRSSIVSYTMDALKNCYPYEEEFQRYKEVKTRQAKGRKESLLKLGAQLEKKKQNRLKK